MTNLQLFTILGSIVGSFILLVSVFAWGHADLSGDIDRVEGRVNTVSTDLNSFKDESYRRLNEIGADVASIKATVARAPEPKP